MKVDERTRSDSRNHNLRFREKLQSRTLASIITKYNFFSSSIIIKRKLKE